jgi:hypothetical protein
MAALNLTLMNLRESCVPEIRETERLPIELEEGQPPFTFVREYKATIQVLVDGDTRSVLQYMQTINNLGGVLADFPASLSNIRVDDENFFVAQTDLHIPEPLKTNRKYVVSFSEVTVNYDRTEFGKMNCVLTFDVLCPAEYFDGATNSWKILPIGGLEDESL